MDQFRQQASSVEFLFYIDVGILTIGLLCNIFALICVITSKFVLRCYRRFLISLIASDILMVTLSFISTFGLNSLGQRSDPSQSQFQHCVTVVLRNMLLACGFANLFNLLAMSVDHFIGIVRH